jgi:H+/Cl- antiporter ClcA
MIVVCRLVNLSGTTFSIELIPFTTWWGILLWIVLGVIFGLIFLLLYKNTDKISAWAKKKFSKNKNNEEK